MKHFIGSLMLFVGAHLWQNGGWTGDETYDDLSISGRIGFNLFMKGCTLVDVTDKDLEWVALNY